MPDKKRPSDPTFRPLRGGLSKVLGGLEAEVMEVVWAWPEPVCSARDVHEQLERLGVQYITLVTVLNNLVRKGLLKRERQGRAFLYKPRVQRAEFLQTVSRDVITGVIGLGSDVAISSFVDLLAEMAPEQLEMLKQKLAERQNREGRQK